MKSLAALLLGGCTIIVPCEKAETPRASEFSYGYGGDFYYGGT